MKKEILENEVEIRKMENTVKLTKDEIIDEVKRTGILHERYFSAATVKLIHSYYDYDETVKHFGT